MNYLDEDTDTGQPSWFALQDIDARSDAAYVRHSLFFDNLNHIKLCNKVEVVLRDQANLWKAAYHTARAETKKCAVHTQVKLDKVEFRKGGLAAATVALLNLGVDKDDITYSGRSMSISVRVK